MMIEDLSDQEIGMLAVALKYWRANRKSTSTRLTDPTLPYDGVDLLLAKLDGACMASLPSDRDIIFNHNLLNDFDQRKRH
jgi:hypothetical protein